MKRKRKRAPGGGRKPSGPFAQNAAQLTIRMPADLRDELERSASKKGWSLTQELLFRVRSSYKRQREDERRPRAVRALRFLISTIAERVGFFALSKWHRNPFAFRAFRLAVAQLLGALEPTGEMPESPYEVLFEVLRDGKLNIDLTAEFKTPESVGDFTAKAIVNELLCDPRSDLVTAFRELRGDPDLGYGAELFLDDMYAFADARRDLGIEPKEAQS